MSFYVDVSFAAVPNEDAFFDKIQEIVDGIRKDPRKTILDGNLYALTVLRDLNSRRNKVHRMQEFKTLYWPQHNMMAVFGGYLSRDFLSSIGFTNVTFQDSVGVGMEDFLWPDIPYFKDKIERSRARASLMMMDTEVRQRTLQNEIFSDLKLNVVMSGVDYESGPEMLAINASFGEEMDIKVAREATKMIREMEEEL